MKFSTFPGSEKWGATGHIETHHQRITLSRVADPDCWHDSRWCSFLVLLKIAA